MGQKRSYPVKSRLRPPFGHPRAVVRHSPGISMYGDKPRGGAGLIAPSARRTLQILTVRIGLIVAAPARGGSETSCVGRLMEEALGVARFMTEDPRGVGASAAG